MGGIRLPERVDGKDLWFLREIGVGVNEEKDLGVPRGNQTGRNNYAAGVT
jgi:hypothetical protein